MLCQKTGVEFLIVSMMVGNSSRRRLHSISSSMLTALSLTVDELLGALLTCSVNLSRITSLSVRMVFPSALSRGGGGVAPELFGL